MSILQKLEESISNNLNESSLSRLVQHMENHDTGTITAFRGTKDCSSDEPYNDEYKMTYKENRQRQKSLMMKLQRLGYDLTSVKGSYIENYGSDDAIEVGESVFFVVDGKDKGTLRQDLMTLGEEFEQDSVLFIPKGCSESELIGTNHCPSSYPSYHASVQFQQRGVGKEGMFMTKVKGRPFIFESILIHHTNRTEISWHLGRKLGAEVHWSKIQLSEDEIF